MEKQYKRVCLSTVFMLSWAVVVLAQAPDTLWTRTYGGGDRDWGFSVEQTSDGGYIIAGRTDSFGAGGWDVYLIKTDADGDTLWTRTYGGADSDDGYSVRETSDGGYIVAGGTNSFGVFLVDAYLVKVDADGDTMWTKTYGDTGVAKAFCVQQTCDSGYIIAGTIRLSGPDADVYLIKTDGDGDTVWTAVYGDTGEDWGMWVQETSDSGYVVAGITDSYGAGGFDAWLLRTDADGDTLWTRTYGDTGHDAGHAVQQTSDGGYILVGRTSSFGDTADVYLIKTDADGDTMWTKTYGGIGYEDGRFVQETSDSGYIITGWTESFGAGGEDVYLIKTNANGDTLWTETCRGTEDDQAYCVRQTSDGGYIIAGSTRSFGAGDWDVYLIKTAPDVGIEEGASTQRVFFAFVNCPNPFTDKTSVKYGILNRSSVQLTIYNLLGQQVRTLIDEEQAKGLHTVIWNGRDDAGMRVPCGTYFLRLQSGQHTAARKVCVVR